MVDEKLQNASILLVEDDDAIRSLVSMAFDLQDCSCICAATGADAIDALIKRMPDIVILDLGLPDIDGTELIRKVRAWSEVPIIVLSARSEDVDKINALDAGADDYLVKPFSIEELFARVRVSLRHARLINLESEQDKEYKNGDLYIDFVSAEVFVGGELVYLTPMEYQLLCLLAKNTNKVLTHNYILKEIWGSSLETDKSSLRVFMATLRKKIEKDPSNPQYIHTRIGIGYCLRSADLHANPKSF